MPSTMRLGAVCVVMLSGLACGPEDGLLELETKEQSVIVGSVDWVESSTLTGPPASRALAVAYLYIPSEGTRCTGWLASDDVLITNNHCINSAQQAVGAKASFNYEEGVPSRQRVWYSCSKFLKTWVQGDMTALRCDPKDGLLPGQVYGHLKVAQNNAPKNEDVYVLHQNCDFLTDSGCAQTKKYSPGVVLSVSLMGIEFSYSADTLGGSSGSPVLSAITHEVVGLHHRGVGGDDSGRGSSNRGTKATAVRSRLAELGIH